MARKLRLHYPDGVVKTELLATTARMNGVPFHRVGELVEAWVRDGALRARPDGGYDVIRKVERGTTSLPGLPAIRPPAPPEPPYARRPAPKVPSTPVEEWTPMQRLIYGERPKP